MGKLSYIQALCIQIVWWFEFLLLFIITTRSLGPYTLCIVSVLEPTLIQADLNQFQDMNNFESDPEEFARIFCEDMGIKDPEVGVSYWNVFYFTVLRQLAI